MENASLRKRTLNAIERLDAIEQSIQQIINAVNASLGNMNTQVTSITDVLDAVVTILGVEQIQNQVVENRRLRLEEEAKRQAEQVEELKKQGILVPAEKVGAGSLLVGKETDKEGKVLGVGRSQLRFSQVSKEIGEKMLGQPVGFQVDTPPGGKWEVAEIYDIVEKKSEEVSAAAAPEAAGTAPAEVQTEATQPAPTEAQ